MPCFLCRSEESLEVCPHCKSVEACSENHMAVHRFSQDGRTPGAFCSPFVIQRRPVIGNVMVAGRSVQAGEIIFIETPAVEGPDSKSYPVCVNCLKNVHLLENERKFCSKCGFPVCDIECENGKNHLIECDILSRSKSSSSIQFAPKKTCFPYSAIFPLRILKTKCDHPDVWDRINLLMDHVNDLEEDMKTLYEKTADFILNTCNAGDIFSKEEIIRALGIFRTNGVNQGLSQGFGLYSTFSFLSHNCSPNARYQIFSDHSLILRATQDIPKGEEMTISYLPIYQATFRRRMKLKNNWMFDCHCKRCSDPTEFGSFLSGVICKECEVGTILPKDSTDHKSAWTCNKCQLSVSSSSILNTVYVIENSIELFVDEDPTSIDNKIEAWSSVLHPNHYLLFLLQRRLLDNLCSNESFNSRESLEKIINLGQNIIKIVNILEPGLSSTRGRILKQIHKPSLLLAKMDLEEKEITSKEFMQRTQDIIKNMKIAVKSLEDYGLHDSSENYNGKMKDTIYNISSALKKSE